MGYVSCGVVPPKGFVIEEGRTLLRADTKEGLVQVLQNHRIENGIPVGDPEKDIGEWFQRQKDINDGKVPSVYPHQPVIERIKNLADRVANWASNRYSKIEEKIHYVQAEESDARASMCAECPKNLNWRKTTTCSPCVSNTDRVLLMLRRGNKTGRNLGACQYYGHDNETACFLPDSMLKHAGREEFKDGPGVPCWLFDSIHGRA